jgi:hypothetical protein
MIRVGIVDCDTSHCVEFTKRLNHVAIDEEQWVNGAQVVCAWAGPSEITPQETIEQYLATLKGFGVRIVDTPEQMIGQVTRFSSNRRAAANTGSWRCRSWRTNRK